MENKEQVKLPDWTWERRRRTRIRSPVRVAKFERQSGLNRYREREAIVISHRDFSLELTRKECWPRVV